MANLILLPASVVLGLIMAAIVISSVVNKDAILSRLGLNRRATDVPQSFDSEYVTDIKLSTDAENALKSGPSVVLLYAHWCHHCKVMMKAYNDAAAASPNIKWLRVEASAAGESVVKRPEVRGFPTIFGVKSDGTIITHEGARDQGSLQRFAESL
jgi:thiol:disulfide interchange protein